MSNNAAKMAAKMAEERAEDAKQKVEAAITARGAVKLSAREAWAAMAAAMWWAEAAQK